MHGRRESVGLGPRRAANGLIGMVCRLEPARQWHLRVPLESRCAVPYNASSQRTQMQEAHSSQGIDIGRR